MLQSIQTFGAQVHGTLGRSSNDFPGFQSLEGIRHCWIHKQSFALITRVKSRQMDCQLWKSRACYCKQQLNYPHVSKTEINSLLQDLSRSLLVKQQQSIQN